jgi:hypothetical protein
MAERHKVALLLLHGGSPRDLEAREQLAAALPDGGSANPMTSARSRSGSLPTIRNRLCVASGTRSPRPVPTITSPSSSIQSCPSTGGHGAGGLTADRVAADRVAVRANAGNVPTDALEQRRGTFPF